MPFYIREVLDEIEKSGLNNKPFSLVYITSKGEKREYKQLIKPYKSYAPTDLKNEKSNFRYHIKSNGILMLNDIEANHNRSLKIRQITHFNGQVINHERI